MRGQRRRDRAAAEARPHHRAGAGTGPGPRSDGLSSVEPLRLRDRAAAAALVYVLLAMWAGVVVVTGLAVAGVSAQDSSVPMGVLAVSVVVAMVTAVPMARWLRPQVEAVLWSHPDDAPALLTDLGHRLTALGPGGGGGDLTAAGLSAEVATQIGRRLRLPYVAVLDAGQEAMPPAGVDAASLARVPLIFAGEIVGEIVAAPRRRDRVLSTSALGLLHDVATQIAVALHAVRARDAVERSRAEVVTAREEERLRIRRDLHDGLGPTLASLGLHLAAVEQLVDRDPTAAVALVQGLRAEVRSTSALVRELVYDLRPPLLDDAGLIGAIRSRAQELTGPGRIAAVVEVGGALPPLPAAVEVALYRIACEALTNVGRHAFATRVCVRLGTHGDDVRLCVEDDGRGLPPGLLPGVGLTAMRERAEELRGTLAVRSGPVHGTEVEVLLPLVVASGHGEAP